jgi:chromosome segregation ATPase
VTVSRLSEHEQSSALLGEHLRHQARLLEAQLAETRVQLESTLRDLEPTVHSTTALVRKLDASLADSREQARCASNEIEQAATMAVRAASELQATSQRLLTRVAIAEERQKAYEAELKVAVRGYVERATAAALEALRAETLELVRSATAEMRYEASAARRTADGRLDDIAFALRELQAEAASSAMANGALERSLKELAHELELAEARARGAGLGARAPPVRAESGELMTTISELQHDLFVHARALEQLKRHRIACPGCGAWHVVGELIRLESVGAPRANV